MSTIAADPGFVPSDLNATDWSALDPLYTQLRDRELMCAGCLEQLLLDRSELDAAVQEAYSILYIAMTCDTEDESAKTAYLDYVENVEPHLKQAGFELDRTIVACPHKGDLDGDRYGVMLRDLEADVELFREENIPLQTEDTRLQQKYNEISGAMLVTFRGEEKTLPQMSKHLEDVDRATREEAWRLMAERRLQDQEKLSDIFDEMITLRHRSALNAGFENYRDYAFKAKHRFDYGPAECEAFHLAAEQVCVPVARRLNVERAEAMGVDPLRPWDLAVDTRGRDPLRPFDGPDELVEGSSRLFRKMDAGLGELFDSLRNGDCLDLDSRRGKAPGGYQMNRDRRRQPFIFMNAAGMHRDLETMVHEAGHAFHSLLCKEDPLVHYRHAPIEFAEVASMSMELMAHPYLGEFYDEAEAARARRTHLEGMVKLLPWIATIDAFQHWLYTNPTHGRAERTACWLELDERFGPGVSWDGFESIRETTWHRQLHLFEVPFYYIEYGIAQLGALQLWLQSLTSEAKALDHYRRAMTLGGSRPLPDLFDAAGLAFDFGPDTMKRLMDEVQGQLDTLPA